MILFKPSEQFVRELFEYHKTTRIIKRQKLSPELIASIQEQIGYTFRHVLVTFAYKMLLERFGKEKEAGVASLVMIIDIGGTRFENGFDGMLKNKLGIQDDAFGKSKELICMLRDDFQAWLIGLGGFLRAEETKWPYLFIIIHEHGGVSMDLNQDINLNLEIQ